jgi:hypothetical protein
MAALAFLMLNQSGSNFRAVCLRVESPVEADNQGNSLFRSLSLFLMTLQAPDRLFAFAERILSASR